MEYVISHERDYIFHRMASVPMPAGPRTALRPFDGICNLAHGAAVRRRPGHPQALRHHPGAVHSPGTVAGADAHLPLSRPEPAGRSEERRVGEEGRSRWAPDY